MPSDGKLVGDAENGSREKAKVKRQRRALTSAEKDARQQKRLRDQYGNSRLDPSEPPLHGLTAAAILCALDLLRRAFRTAGRFKPKSIADRAASICSLSAEQHKLLIRWLAWVKPRRWILQEEGRSAVVAWSISRRDNSAVWTAELDAQWRAHIQTSVASDEAEAPAKERPNASTERRVASPTSAPKSSQVGERPSRSDPMPQPGVAASASRGPMDRSHASSHSNPALPSSGQHLLGSSPPVESKPAQAISATVSIDQDKVINPPFPIFVKGRDTANRFAKASREFLDGKGSADDLKIAAGNLLKDVPACREFCQRSSEHRRFLESIISQLGWEVP